MLRYTCGLLFCICTLSLHAQESVDPMVIQGQLIDVSPELRSMNLIRPSATDTIRKYDEVPNPSNEINPGSDERENNVPDPLRQDFFGSRALLTPPLSFEGVSKNSQGIAIIPPDTDGDIGPNHYIQMVNIAFEIFDRSGTSLTMGPASLATIWQGLPAPFTNGNRGDPIVLYDEIADRWLMSEFAFQNTSSPPWHMLVAISTTNDPLGTYYRYAFDFSLVGFPDYPKLGVWPDGYYMSLNIFSPFFIGASAAALQRDAMLAGAPANMILFPPNNQDFSYLPADLDGPLPPAGSPNYFVQLGQNNSSLDIFEFAADWITPSNSTFTKTSLAVTPFESDLCVAVRERCIDQPAPGPPLESLAGRMMFPLKYRNFGTHESLVMNHTIDVLGAAPGTAGQAGIRWYELGRMGGGWTLKQEGSYAPDTDHRFMGSIAINKYGDIMLGYSVSSTTTFPSIRFTGRLASDPPGVMTINESSIAVGQGSQTGGERWGDYSAMSVDPMMTGRFGILMNMYKLLAFGIGKQKSHK